MCGSSSGVFSFTLTGGKRFLESATFLRLPIGGGDLRDFFQNFFRMVFNLYRGGGDGSFSKYFVNFYFRLEG